LSSGWRARRLFPPAKNCSQTRKEDNAAYGGGPERDGQNCAASDVESSGNARPLVARDFAGEEFEGRVEHLGRENYANAEAKQTRLKSANTEKHRRSGDGGRHRQMNGKTAFIANRDPDAVEGATKLGGPEAGHGKSEVRDRRPEVSGQAALGRAAAW